MSVSIDSSELERLLSRMPASQNLMLAGRHGIGKSQMLTRYFEARGMRVVTLFLGQMSDPGDLIGLPVKNTDTGKTDFMPPYWFPTDGKPVVLFLDELNRARPEVLQTIMDLALNRKLAGRSLPEGSRLISAVNDGEEYQLTDLDPALVSRFNVYTFRPTAQDWLLWADKNGIDRRVIDFIGTHSEWLDGEGGNGEDLDTGLEKTPDRRGWEKVSVLLSQIEDPDTTDFKIIAGMVGVRASAAFAGFLSRRNGLGAEDVLLRFPKHKKALAASEVHELVRINESIFRFLDLQDLDDDQRKMAGKNLCAYVDLLAKKQEAMAYFTALFQGGKHRKAISFIVMEAAPVFRQVTCFVKNL